MVGKISVLTTVWVLICGGVNALPSHAQSASLHQQVQEVVSHLDGAMDTSAQARTNPKAPNVRITTCRVNVENAAALMRPHAVFMYQEQASQRLAQPYSTLR